MKYSINFSTTQISIADIKSEIIKKRNMDKVPEKFELLIHDENNNEIRDDNYKVEPLKLLIIRRIPWYKQSSTFIEKIRDPSEISSLRFSDFVISSRKINVPTSMNLVDPLEKISSKINLETYNKIFGCKICNKTEDDPVLMLCCGETICEKCAKENKCSCAEENKGYMPNKKVKEMKERVLSIINKHIKGHSQSTTRNPNMVLHDENAISQNQSQNIPTDTSHLIPEQKNKLPQLVPVRNENFQSQTLPLDTVFNPYIFFLENSDFLL